jgi:hypothetical protein
MASFARIAAVKYLVLVIRDYPTLQSEMLSLMQPEERIIQTVLPIKMKKTPD